MQRKEKMSEVLIAVVRISIYAIFVIGGVFLSITSSLMVVKKMNNKIKSNCTEVIVALLSCIWISMVMFIVERLARWIIL